MVYRRGHWCGTGLMVYDSSSNSLTYYWRMKMPKRNRRVVVHVRHHADHEDDVLRHDHDEHVVDVPHHRDNALLHHLHDDGPPNEDHDHDHDCRDAHRHHDNSLLFRHVHVLRDVLRHDHDHVHVLHDVPHRGGEYDDDFRGETFSQVSLKSKLRM
ncbi:hypothetical protein CFP56_026426 [Quercus suber]|uniref:Uncharacterized protein n=1 Tax=Quercus suber TaxID=58331 RepID=A0AAW0LY75_QUESU